MLFRRCASQVDQEILHASVKIDSASSQHDRFRDVMVAFSENAAAQLRHCQEAYEGAVASLKEMVHFFGESWSNDKPATLFRIVSDFLAMFDKTVAEFITRQAKQDMVS